MYLNGKFFLKMCLDFLNHKQKKRNFEPTSLGGTPTCLSACMTASLCTCMQVTSCTPVHTSSHACLCTAWGYRINMPTCHMCTPVHFSCMPVHRSRILASRTSCFPHTSHVARPRQRASNLDRLLCTYHGHVAAYTHVMSLCCPLSAVTWHACWLPCGTHACLPF